MFTSCSRLLVWAVILLPGGRALGADAGPRVSDYRLDVEFFPAEGRMWAWAEIKFADPSATGSKTQKSLDALRDARFYLHDGLSVISIEVSGEKAEFETAVVPYSFNYTNKATRVSVSLKTGQSLADGMSVTYEGKFNPSDARSPSDYMRIDSGGVLLRSYGYSLWFPVFLEAERDGYDVDFSRVIVRTPEGFVPVFTGKRLREWRETDGRVSQWQAAEVGLFAAQVTARQYALDKGDGVFIYREKTDPAREAGAAMLTYVQRLRKLFGEHYGPKLELQQVHVMQMPKFGDISSGNVIGVSNESWVAFGKDTSTKRLLAHEFVHPFVQVRTLRSDPLYALMIEGFPSYFHLPILAELEGEEFYEQRLAKIQQRYIQKRQSGKTSRGGSLPEEKAIYDIGPDEIGKYKDTFVLNDRALLFFDSLRRVHGKEAFFRFAGELFGSASLDHKAFEALVVRHFGVSREDVRLWLRTSEYPERMHRKKDSGGD